MRLTLHTDYSLRVLIYLARQEQPSTIAAIAQFYGISHHHLTKVVQRLSAIGYVESSRGRGGGLWLAQNPAVINIGDVVRLTERDLGIVECMSSDSVSGCRLESSCILKGVLGKALAAFLAELDKYNLADLVDLPAGTELVSLLSES